MLLSRMGGGLGLGMSRLQASSGLNPNPALIFGVADNGYFIDPDLTSSWQDNAGTVAGAVAQPVGRVTDKSGKGNHFLQATTARKPTLRAAPVGSYLEMDGVDDYMILAAAMLWASATGGTVIVGLRSAAGTMRPFGEYSNASANPLYSVLVGDGGVTTSQTSLIRDDTGAVNVLSPGAHTVANAYTGADKVITAQDLRTSWQNRVNRGAWGALAYARGASALTVNQSSLGAVVRGAGPTVGNLMAGRLYGIFGINRPLSAAEIAVVENYWAAKMGISL